MRARRAHGGGPIRALALSGFGLRPSPLRRAGVSGFQNINRVQNIKFSPPQAEIFGVFGGITKGETLQKNVSNDIINSKHGVATHLPTYVSTFMSSVDSITIRQKGKHYSEYGMNNYKRATCPQ